MVNPRRAVAVSRPGSVQTQVKPPSILVQGASTLLQRSCACGNHTVAGGECPACAERTSAFQRSVGHSEAPAVPPLVQEVLHSPGHPLEATSRTFMEERFGQDFSRVRVHADARAADSARAVDAHAYTVANHIVFGAGQYAPETGKGGHLLAHELTHVVQQGVGGGVEGVRYARELSSPSDASEIEADVVAAHVMGGGPVRITQPADALVQSLSTGEAFGIGGAVAGAAGIGLGIAALAGAFSSGKKKCPATHTVPDDTYDAITEAWGKSGQGGATVTEHGGRVVTTKEGKRAIRTGSGEGGSISLPAEEAGDVTLGTFHTHPYSKSEGSELGVSFSGGDIENFIAGDQGNVKYIGAGSCNYALETQDTDARNACKKVDISKRWNDSFAAASGSFQGKTETAVKAAIKGCGLCYYKACRPDEKSAIPKVAKLA